MILNYKNYIKENIEDDVDETVNERNWEVKVEGKTRSYWEYKHDAIDDIIEVLEWEGLEDYEEDGEILLNYEIADMLDDLDEDDFYEKLDEIKSQIRYDGSIKLINLNDEDELEFIEED